MKPDIVVDIGNSRMKWGRCVDGVVGDVMSLREENAVQWSMRLVEWKLEESEMSWAVAGVDPKLRDEFAEWLRVVQAPHLVLTDNHQLPVRVQVDEPRLVGMDRLLNAVAANERGHRAAHKILIDAGSAVTVDWVDDNGVFRGGTIFPGLNLMGNALRDYTAKLPLIEKFDSDPPLPGLSTRTAIQAGIYWVVVGGIQTLVRRLQAVTASSRCKVFLTGGDADLLAPVMDTDVILWPEMTLEGIRLSAEALP